ncbi:MAG: hypothetical protein LBS73_00915 [Campylobacteraceae bacterium]|jgi:hypothetical protein|nr:hypothetical protein [Campylobacteraceae bacterium]
MLSEVSKRTRVALIISAVIVICIAFVAAIHFFVLHKTEHAFDDYSLSDVIKVEFAADARVGLRYRAKCATEGFLKYHCHSIGGGFIRKTDDEQDIVSFDEIEYSIAFSSLKSLQIKNISSAQNSSSIDHRFSKLIYPIDIKVDKSARGFKVSMDGAFGNLSIISEDMLIAVAAKNEDLIQYFYEFFKEYQQRDDMTFNEFKKFANDNINELKLKKVVQNSIYFSNAIEVAEDILNGKSNGFNIEIYLKSRDQNKISSSIRMFILTGQPNTQIFDVEISNLPK